MPNPYASTAMAVVGPHLMKSRAWTYERVQEWYASLYDRVGWRRRFKIVCRYHCLILAQTWNV